MTVIATDIKEKFVRLDKAEQVALMRFFSDVVETEEAITPTENRAAEIERLLEIGRQPTPDFISVEQLAKEQGYSTEKLIAAHERIDHSLFADEDLDELLAMI